MGSRGSSFLVLAIRKFMGLIIKKKIDAATNRKEIRAFRKCPYIKRLLFRVKDKSEKSGTLTIAAIKGVIKSDTRAVTTEPKAAPTTTPGSSA